MENIIFKDEKSGKFGLKDENGKIIIPCEYDFLDNYNFPGYKHIIVVKKDSKMGVLDENGKVIIDIKHDGLVPIFGPDFPFLRRIRYCVEKDNKLGIVSKNSDKPEYLYDSIDSGTSPDRRHPMFDSSNVIPVEKDGKWGAIDFSTLDKLVDCEYESLKVNSKNTIIVTNKKGKKGAFDTAGKMIVKCKYDGIDRENRDGLRPVMIGDKYGFIDKYGKEVLKCKYDYVKIPGLIETGLMQVRKGDDTIFVDAQGKRVTKYVYGHDVTDKKHERSILILEYYVSGLYKEYEPRKGDYKHIDRYVDDVLNCKLVLFKHELLQANSDKDAYDVYDKYFNEIKDFCKYYLEGIKIEFKDRKNYITDIQRKFDFIRDQIRKQLQDFTKNKGFDA